MSAPAPRKCPNRCRPARLSPVVLATYVDESITITVVPPLGRTIRTDGADGRADSPHGSAERRISRGGGTLNVRHDFLLKATRIAAADYRAFLDFATAADGLSTAEIEIADAAPVQE